MQVSQRGTQYQVLIWESRVLTAYLLRERSAGTHTLSQSELSSGEGLVYLKIDMYSAGNYSTAGDNAVLELLHEIQDCQIYHTEPGAKTITCLFGSC